MLPRTALAARIAVITAAAIALALLPATAAEAADEVTVSTDGTTYGSGLSGPLFGTIIGLVPQESRSEVLWVQNSSPHDVILQITLDTTSWTDESLAAALSVGASAPGATGSTAVASSAGACRLLLSGASLDPGESIPVTITLALGSLTDQVGQYETVSINLGVTIVETSGSVQTGACTTPAGDPVVTIPLTPSTDAVASDSESSDGEGVVRPTPRPTQPADSPIFVLASMIGFNDSPLLWALIAALAGGAIFYLIEYSPWRRRRMEDDEGQRP